MRFDDAFNNGQSQAGPDYVAGMLVLDPKKAAELLGVARVTVWNRMRRFGIQFKKKIENDHR